MAHPLSLGSRQLRIGILLLGAGLIPAGALGCAAHQPDIVSMVMHAQTPADHEAIAAYYEQQRAMNQEQAGSHRQLAETYRRFHNSYKNMMAPHCEIAADEYSIQRLRQKTPRWLKNIANGPKTSNRQFLTKSRTLGEDSRLTCGRATIPPPSRRQFSVRSRIPRLWPSRGARWPNLLRLWRPCPSIPQGLCTC